jgi:hypothetical protein
MLRAFAVVVAIAVTVAAAGCSPNVERTTTTSTIPSGTESPESALRTLLSAIDVGDVDAAASVTFEDQVALLISLDGATLDEAVAFIEDGVPSTSQALFWESFRATYTSNFEEALSDMVVAESGRVTVDGVEFSLIEVALRKNSGHTRWLARVDKNGRWRVDLFATFASTFAQPMRLWLTTLPNAPGIAVLRRAIAAQSPSLLAALQQQPLGPTSPGVAAQIRGLLADVGATG